MKRVGSPRGVVWVSSKPPGVEYCTVAKESKGWVLEGSLVRRSGRGSAVLSYSIQTDARWRTKRVSVERALKGRRRALKLEVKESRWFVDGREDRRLRGCLDVDLEASPVTNTLPIRRTLVKTGSRVDLTACWVRFPSLKVEPLSQSYERLGERVFRYRSASGFSAEIEVDGFGIVRRYGDYWLAV